MYRFSYRTEQVLKFIIAAVAIITLFAACTWVSLHDTKCHEIDNRTPSFCNNK